MSIQSIPPGQERGESGGSRNDEGGLRAPPGLSPLGKVWWWFHFAILVKLARLRFIAILVAIGVVIAQWDTLRAYYDKWTRPILGQETAVSADSDYWCPMHPTIVRDHPDKCPICAMPLSKRKKGETGEGERLPSDVVSRVQLTPYKVIVAGIETAPIGHQPLTHDIRAVGSVEFDERKRARITARAPGKSRIDKLFVNVTGQTIAKGEPLVDLYSPALLETVQNLLNARKSGKSDLETMARDLLQQRWSVDASQIDKILQSGQATTHMTIRSPLSGHVITKYQVEGEYVEEGAPLFDVADLSTVWIEAQIYENDVSLLKVGLPIRATTRAFPNREFKGQLAFIHPHLDAATRTLLVRFDMDNPNHELRPGMYATVDLHVPATELIALPKEATEKQKQSYKEGLVLAVPERAVIDTGSRKFVYRESEPDVFDGIEVELGPRCGDHYPVIRGLQAGERVATTGSFLIDAETRLTAGASSTYFGASGGPQGDHRSATTSARPSLTRDEEEKARAVLAKLSPSDRELAEAQVFCPVLGTRLGTMGVPVPVALQGQKVFLCCKACLKKAQADEKGTLARVADLKEKKKGQGGAARDERSNPEERPPSAPAGETVLPKVKANLAKLGAEDRRLAEEQGYCPVEPDIRLGEMGVPVVVEIKGQKVFLCCKACKDDALKDPDQTLAHVKKLKSKARVK